jgi:hypothetical protein
MRSDWLRPLEDNSTNRIVGVLTINIQYDISSELMLCRSIYTDWKQEKENDDKQTDMH